MLRWIKGEAGQGSLKGTCGEWSRGVGQTRSERATESRVDKREMALDANGIL